MARLGVALVGIGKIALDQHVPALAASPDWELQATVSRQGRVEGVPSYPDLKTMFAAHPQVKMVSLCLPPVPRYAFAEQVLQAGRHLMLEKPPGASLAEVQALAGLAQVQGLSLYTTWHSRMAHAVAAAKARLAGCHIRAARVVWREDVRKWHPGQHWVFEPGGMGVFDPGINALSILTEILPMKLHLRAADLSVPINCQTPIAAELTFSGNVTASFDWRQTGPQIWDIEVETDQGPLALRMGGNILEIAGEPVEGENSIMGEYPALYARMAELVAQGRSDIDLEPMIHVADAMTLGRRQPLPPFDL